MTATNETGRSSGSSRRGYPVALTALHVLYGGYGGQFSVVHELARGLKSRGISSVACLYAPPAELVRDPARLTAFDAIVHVEKCGRIDRRGKRRITSIMRAASPDVLLWHSHYAGIGIARERMRRKTPPIIMVEHTAAGARRRPDLLRSLVGALIADRIVFQTHEERARYSLRRLPLSSISHATVIPNGVDLGRFRPTHHDSAGPRPVHIGMIARMVPGKDFATLVEATGLLRAENPGVQFRVTLAGDGPDRPALQSLVARAGLKDVVSFVGQLDAGQVAALMGSLDVLVHATKAESVSMALLEGYAAGLAIVTTDVPGVRTLVRPGIDGCLVPASDAPAMSAALRHLLECPVDRERYRSAARARAVAEFGSDRMANAYYELLHDVIEPATGA